MNSSLVSPVDPPQINQHPASPVFLGSQVAFTVAPINCPVPLAYKWELNDADSSDRGDVSGTTTNTLTIASVKKSDKGMYKCHVSNTAGATNISNSAQLTVCKCLFLVFLIHQFCALPDTYPATYSAVKLCVCVSSAHDNIQ